MSLFASTLCSLVLFSQLNPCTTTSSNSAQLAQSPGKFVVKLHRQRVPVKSESEAMSYKSVYFGTIYIGSPKQEFSVVFDTGSGHVVLPAEECQSNTCRIHRRYNRRLSPHAVDVDYDGTPVKPGTPRDQITVAYGTGEVTGQFVQEALCLSNDFTEPTNSSDTPSAAPEVANASTLESDCLSLRVVMATEMTHDPFHAFSFDGVLGLGLSGLSLAPEFNFFGELLAQGKIAEPVFGVFLADNDEDQSEICFGGHSTERLQSDPMWSPVALPDAGFWQVQIQKVRVGNTSFSFCDDGQCRAVVDTGTSVLAVPHDFNDELHDALSSSLQDPPRGSSGTGIDCKHARGSLLHFDIDGLTVTLSAGDYARQAIMLEDATQDSVSTATEEELISQGTESKCQPTLLPLDMAAPLGPKLFIWGEPVLRKYYTLYDLAKKRIGFGLAAQSPQHAQQKTKEPLLQPLLL